LTDHSIQRNGKLQVKVKAECWAEVKRGRVERLGARPGGGVPISPNSAFRNRKTAAERQASNWSSCRARGRKIYHNGVHVENGCTARHSFFEKERAKKEKHGKRRKQVTGLSIIKLVG